MYINSIKSLLGFFCCRFISIIFQAIIKSSDLIVRGFFIIKKTINSISQIITKNMNKTPKFNKRSSLFMMAPAPSVSRIHRKILLIKNRMMLVMVKVSHLLCRILICSPHLFYL